MRNFGTRWLLYLGAVGAGFVLVGATTITAWEYTNSNAFCANACHSVHPEEPLAHRYSRHANVRCVECHLGRIPVAEAFIVKSGHLRHVWHYLTGYERPVTSYSMPVSAKSCESCHTHQPHRDNVLKIYHYFAEDEKNTETRLGLVIRLAGRQSAEQSGEGIRWHTSSAIRFITTDTLKQSIPWVEVTRPDGTKTVYQDRTQSLSESEIAAAEPSTMQCKDCHNRVGHPFPDPEEVVDRALADGRLNSEFPFVKKRAIGLLKQEFDSKEQAQRLVEDSWEKYARDYPQLAEKYPQAWAESKAFLQERQAAMMTLMTYSRFDEPGLSWRSFPENAGHKHSPGCFRCHDGKHLDPDLKPIAVNCTTCHSVPLPFINGKIPTYLLNTINMNKPESHTRPDFMIAHWTKYVEGCSNCHVQFSYGTRNEEFCANSGCHNIRWQSMSLRYKPGAGPTR